MQKINDLRNALDSQRGKLQALDSKGEELRIRLPELNTSLQAMESQKRQVSVKVAVGELTEADLGKVLRSEESIRQEVTKAGALAGGIDEASVDLKNLIRETEAELLAAERSFEREVFEREKTEILKKVLGNVHRAYACDPLYNRGPYPHAWEKFLHELFGDPPAPGEADRLRSELLKIV